MSRSRRRRRRSANRRSPVLIIVTLIVIFALAALAGELISMRLPTKELANLQELYGSEDGYATVITDHEVQEEKALWLLDHAFLSYDMIRSEVNGRFYWDPVEERLLYTLPEEVVSADSESAFDGAPVFLQQDGTLYLSLAYVQQYSNIQADHFTDPNRLVLKTEWGTETTASVKSDETAVRVKGGIKSPIVVMLSAGDTVTVLEQMDHWTGVQTSNGLQGYVQNEDLTDIQENEVSGPYTEPDYYGHPAEGKVCMAWHQLFGKSGLDSFREFLTNTPDSPFNVIAPTWLSLTDEEGTIESAASADYVAAAHEAGMAVWATLENVNHEVDMTLALQETARRTHLIEQTMEAVAACGADGLNLDFERIPESAGEAYVQLVREFGIACRLAGVTFSVDDMPPSGWASYYNIREQGKMADYVVIMAYDEHYAGSDAGSTASLPYVQQSMVDTLERVKAEKVICALPFYTRLWKDTPEGLTSEAMSMGQASAYVTEHGGEITWLDDLGQNYARMKEGDTVSQIWLEDAASMQAKLQMLTAYDIGGVSFWKLGMQTEEMWPLIREYLS
ncbi:MAG: SH3 domain-containing protein [Lachnospiraceae bacterium]|nr:SH3 domain-containing protein [Lachnospiraceae bacterium]